LKTTLTLGIAALGSTAFLLGQMTASAGGKGDGGVAGGSTNCATAPALALGDNPFDTSGSTVSAAIGAGTGCTAHTMFKVNYFTFTPATTGNHTFSTCNGTGWDSRLAILAACGGATVACNDDACGLQSTITASLTAGTVYRVVIVLCSPHASSLHATVAPPQAARIASRESQPVPLQVEKVWLPVVAGVKVK